MGSGDIKAFNPQSQVPTPNLDKLANRGMRFTDAHSGSAVCTPTRYGLVTGRYAFRSSLKKGVLGGYSPALIEADRFTVADLLKKAGYKTGVIGKWHLGLGFSKTTQSVVKVDTTNDGLLARVLSPISHWPKDQTIWDSITAILSLPRWISPVHLLRKWATNRERYD